MGVDKAPKDNIKDSSREDLTSSFEEFQCLKFLIGMSETHQRSLRKKHSHQGRREAESL